MSCNVYSVPDEKTSPKFAAAFSAGCGGRVLTEYEPGPWAGFSSPKNWHELQQSIKDGFDFYYGDHGYFGRGKFYRVTKNAIQHHGLGTTDGKRLKNFWPRETPWKKTGSYIILCPQSEHFFSRFGMTYADWIDETVGQLRQHTDRKIIIHGKRDARPLVEFLKDAWAVVGFTSMSGLEALMHGIPAITTKGCAISSLCTRIENIEKPFYPDNRMEVAGVLADNQWTLDEMRSGECWRALNGVG